MLRGSSFNGDVTGLIYEQIGVPQNFVIGDVDNDNLNDIVVGASFYPYDGGIDPYPSGAAFIFLASSNYLNNGPVADISDATITLQHGDDPAQDEKSVLFGLGLTVFDYNNDGKKELAVSAPVFGDFTDIQGGIYIFTSDKLKTLSGTVSAEDNASLFVKGSGFEYTRYYRAFFGKVLEPGDFDDNGSQELLVLSNYNGTGRFDVLEFGNKQTKFTFGAESAYRIAMPALRGLSSSPTVNRTINKVATLLSLGIYQYTVPAYEYDLQHVGYNPVVLKEVGIYKMWSSGYNGSNVPAGSTGWRGAYATATNETTWTKYPTNTCATNIYGNGCIFDHNTTSGSWDDVHVIPSSVINDDGTYKMWYMGHDGSA